MMNNKIPTLKGFWSLCAGFLLALSVAPGVGAAEPAQEPLFMSTPVRPIMMLNMSTDHQLFFKLYDDYNDLDDDGVPDTTYNHDYDYYGYFDSDKCYLYSSGVYEPSNLVSAQGYCNSGDNSNEWSGNFLNWATMTRIDAVRKILYGGLRSVDTDEKTVLERAFLPHDAHSFAKYFNGPNIDRLTPFSVTEGLIDEIASGITLCNTTEGSGLSQDVGNPPLLRVAEGNYSLWASNERWQCRWREDMSSSDEGVNDNDPVLTGIFAHSDSPTKSEAALGDGDYNVRVSVCETGLTEDGCSAYPSGNFKPTGLLQEYGENGAIRFGLMTGSYGKNKSGGMLRKNIGDLSNEININSDGTYKSAPADGNIIDTLNKLRIYGYSYGNGQYSGVEDSDNCPFGLTGFEDGDCSNWGNPQSEIFLESLRYLAGASANTDFAANDSEYINGLVAADWSDPVSNDNYCAPLNVVQFNASNSSYDGSTPGASDIGVSEVSQWVNAVGAGEGIHGNDFFIGESGADADELCTPKTISNLSDARGTCPDAPRLDGTYNISGLAYYARTNSIRADLQGTQTVKTYGVALAATSPTVTVPVPGSEGQVVNILPACQNQQTQSGVTEGNCALVDFKIISQQSTDNTNSGALYINWEAAEQGGDYDSDMWGVLDYSVTSSSVTITTDVMQDSSDRPLGFGYVLSGTSTDGFHVHSGTNSFDYDPVDAPLGARINGCDDCQQGDLASTNIYNIGESSAESLGSPLFYAAKWGGYANDDWTAEDIAASEPENYHFAIDPRELQESLKAAFASVAAGVGSASSVATNSTRLSEGSFVYQARFNSEDWSGEVRAYPIDENGNVSVTPEGSTDSTLAAVNPAFRDVYTYKESDGTRTDFLWQNLSDAQQQALIAGDDAPTGQKRVDWLRGGDADETATGGMRQREKLLGDIVNSSPVYLGEEDRGYSLLPEDQGGGQAYRDFVEAKGSRAPTLFVGANDGMLHALVAGGEDLLEERFAYIPKTVYPKLAGLTDPDYGGQDIGHEYTVDGPLTLGDAYWGGEWHSVLVGTLGAGGKGVFALDVTNPDEPEVLFDLDETDLPGLGYVMGRPVIARMPNERWVAIFGNGYDSGTSRLMVVDLQAPLDDDFSKTIDTTEGSGLSGVAVLGNPYGQVREVYAGDLEGNLWKFDLDNVNIGKWGLAYGEPLFLARDAAGNVQPITGAPTLGFNGQKNEGVIMVYFGTGKYIAHEDNMVKDTDPEHSFYAIADLGEPLDYRGDRDNRLHEKQILQSGNSRDIVGDDEVDWSADDGWYLDFDTQAGERVIVKPLLLFDRLIFPTLIPSTVACEFGGRSWLMELIAVGDRYIGDSLLDGIEQTEALIMGDPTFGVLNSNEGKLLVNRSDGGSDEQSSGLDEKDVEIPAEALGRQSWRQIR